ncbi:hypothetical protein QF006_002410 [Pantoea agglomerans]|jgi:hypothetical protein|nr:hypothetical protein [Pantoea agglomerans]
MAASPFLARHTDFSRPVFINIARFAATIS